MIKKIYFVTIDGEEYGCAHLQYQMSYMMASCQDIAGRMSREERKRYYDIAEDVRDLMIELPEGTKEAGHLIEVFRRRYDLDEENYPDVNAIVNELVKRLLLVMPIARPLFIQKALENSVKYRDMTLKTMQKEEERIMLAENLKPENVNESSLIANIIGKQKAKANDPKYPKESLKNENEVARFLSCLYVESTFSEFISIGLLQSAVELRLVNERDISHILEALGDKRDYEWYMEDLIACPPYDETRIKICDVLKIATDTIETILGYHIAKL